MLLHLLLQLKAAVGFLIVLALRTNINSTNPQLIDHSAHTLVAQSKGPSLLFSLARLTRQVAARYKGPLTLNILPRRCLASSGIRSLINWGKLAKTDDQVVSQAVQGPRHLSLIENHSLEKQKG